MAGPGLHLLQDRRGEIPSHKIDEDDKTLAFMDINPWTRGHALVIPKEHSRNIYDDRRPTTSPRSTSTAQRLAQRMRDRLGLRGHQHLQSSEPVAMQTVFHTHVHVIPRYSDDGLSCRRTRSRPSTTSCRRSRRSSVPRGPLRARGRRRARRHRRPAAQPVRRRADQRPDRRARGGRGRHAARARRARRGQGLHRRRRRAGVRRQDARGGRELFEDLVEDRRTSSRRCRSRRSRRCTRCA